MRTSMTSGLRSVDRRTRVIGLLTVAAFAVAAGSRTAVDRLEAEFASGAPAQDATAPTTAVWFVGADALAGIGAAAAGLGVLLLGATLVSAVRRHDGRRLPLVLAAVGVLLAAGAVGAAVVATTATDVSIAVDASVLRTALAGLAVASLPSVCLTVVRTRSRR